MCPSTRVTAFLRSNYSNHVLPYVHLFASRPALSPSIAQLSAGHQARVAHGRRARSAEILIVSICASIYSLHILPCVRLFESRPSLSPSIHLAQLAAGHQARVARMAEEHEAQIARLKAGQVLAPKPETPKHEVRNPKPETRNPQKKLKS